MTETGWREPPVLVEVLNSLRKCLESRTYMLGPESHV